MKTILVALNAKFSHTNLAVRYLRHSLLAAGIPCEIAEFTINQPVRAIVAALASRQPEALLFSCYLWNIELVSRIGGDLRMLFPKARILLGGPEVSYEAEALLPRFPFADGILCGEGELLAPKVLLGDDIHGVYHPEQYTNLDESPFPYDDLADLKHRVLYYESTRGCPFGCSYCLSSADRKLRRRALPLVFADLQKFLDARVMCVKFVDRTFNLLPERALAIWEYILAHDNGVTCFQMELGGDLITPAQLALLRQARPGLLQFEIGIQSTDAHTLESVCRKTDFQRLSENIRAIKDMGNIHCHLDLIAGLPGEGFERFLQSYDDVFALAPEQLQLGFLKLLRGSALWQARERYGLRHSGYAPYEVLETRDISFGELVRLQQLEEMTEIYYNSGRFSLALAFLLKQAASPARFLLSLAETMPESTPGKYDYYDLLFSFGSRSLDEAGKETLRWLIRADLCLHERPRKLPACCPEGIRPRRAALEALPKEFYAEVFPFSFQDCRMINEPVLTVFDYTNRTLSGHAAVRFLPCDFPASANSI